jgi:hypothetical protein
MIVNHDPRLDHPFHGDMPSPDFAEAQMWNFSDGQLGVMYHVGTMPGDMRLWHNAFSINCPDGSVLATKVVGRGEPDMFGTHAVHSRTLEAYRAWRIHFDGGMRRYRPEELQAAPGTDGVHVPVTVDLEIIASHPVWEPGARSSDPEGSIFFTFAKMHHEQPLTVRGTVAIDGSITPFSGIGHRDHSRGPRDMRTLLRGAWFNATFDSGWAFLGFWGEDRHGVQERSAIYQNGQIILGSMAHSAELATTAPEPQQFEILLRTEDGRERRIQARCTQGVNWFCPGLSEWCVGTDLSDPRNYQWAMAFAEFTCESERGLGFVDRGAMAKLLKPV